MVIKFQLLIEVSLIYGFDGGKFGLVSYFIDNLTDIPSMIPHRYGQLSNGELNVILFPKYKSHYQIPPISYYTSFTVTNMNTKKSGMSCIRRYNDIALCCNCPAIVRAIPSPAPLDTVKVAVACDPQLI